MANNSHGANRECIITNDNAMSFFHLPLEIRTKAYKNLTYALTFLFLTIQRNAVFKIFAMYKIMTVINN